MKKLFALLLVLFWMTAPHAEILENDPRIKISTIEPERDVGYTLGDTLTRTAILEAPRNLTLFETSIPIVGNEKKRRGKGNGIELKEVIFQKTPGVSTNTYTLRLTYQLFKSGVTAKPASLPPEFVKFGGKGEKSFEVRIPSWSFRISPLAVFGSVTVEKDMSGFRGPILVDTTKHRQLLWGALGVMAIALIGLLYILGESKWLPRMGGAFAKALRDLRKIPDTPEGIAQAVSRIHQAFNTTANSSVFDTAEFLKLKPGFASISADIDRFFVFSRSVFFDPDLSHGIEKPAVWLKQFCRRCRDCERGLK